MLSKQPLINILNWKIVEYGPINSVQQVGQQVNWGNLCQLASGLNNGLPCIILDKTTNGLHNLIRLLQFSDQTQWIARINLRRSTNDLAKLRSEVDTMRLIKDRTDIPIPRVFAYEVNKENPIGAPYILMEFLPGNTAMDAAGGYEVHKGRIPLAHCPNFYRSVAHCHVSWLFLVGPLP